MDLAEVERLASAGESETLELKQSTGQLIRAAQTLCGFLNDQGGVVLIGVTPDGRIIGQQVSDKTQQDITSTIRQFEPPASATVRDDLYYLKRLGLIDSEGHGRGAVWALVKGPEE